MKSFAPVYKRCRPSLGTYVEIALYPNAELNLQSIFTAAYATIDRISHSMSFHDAKSELSQLNRRTVGKWLRVSPELFEVLSLALELQTHTKGLFNVAIGIPLVQWGFLPAHHTLSASGENAFEHLNHPGFELDAKLQRARRILPVQLDLGGIAKGYAVDQAVQEIQKIAARKKIKLSGCVNAGGDLRVFGTKSQKISVRTLGGKASESLIQLKNGSVATSSVQAFKVANQTVSAYVNLQKSNSLLKMNTAFAIAESCAVADAFTKIALLAPKKISNPLAKKMGVTFQVMGRTGVVS